MNPWAWSYVKMDEVLFSAWPMLLTSTCVVWAVIALITAVAATARLSLLTASSTAPTASATVRLAAESVSAVVSVSSTVGPTILSPLVGRATLLPSMVIRLGVTLPMVSLNVRITCVPSVDVVGALAPVVTSVGRMPSTF